MAKPAQTIAETVPASGSDSLSVNPCRQEVIVRA
jgi:hypothetical protein